MASDSSSGPLAHVRVVVVSHRGPCAAVARRLLEYQQLGADVLIPSEGLADLSRARNLALTEAIAGPRDQLLLLDDDIVLETQDAVSLCVGEGPVSAVYVSAGGKLAAARMPGSKGLWLTGLGALSVSVQRLRTLAEQLGHCQDVAGQRFVPFCTSGPLLDTPDGPVWLADDYSLCWRLGGVRLRPVCARHVKHMMLAPSDSEFVRSQEERGYHGSKLED